MGHKNFFAAKAMQVHNRNSFDSTYTHCRTNITHMSGARVTQQQLRLKSTGVEPYFVCILRLHKSRKTSNEQNLICAYKQVMYSNNRIIDRMRGFVQRFPREFNKNTVIISKSLDFVFL
uniref:Uncharacterized protein n=1 Tax=Sipha flava TaxID=143950 RepID=A0A2S2QBZ3_9HEMI